MNQQVKIIIDEKTSIWFKSALVKIRISSNFQMFEKETYYFECLTTLSCNFRFPIK